MSHRKETEAMVAEQPIEDWTHIPWRKLERTVYRLQKRIYQASLRGNDKAVHTLQRLLMKSNAARTLAVRRVTQDNQGKRTAGVDGVKSVKPAQRLALVKHLRHHKSIKPQPTRRVWIPKPGKAEKRPLGIPTMLDRAHQCLVKLALEPEWEARFSSRSISPGCHSSHFHLHLQTTQICAGCRYCELLQPDQSRSTRPQTPHLSRDEARH